MRKKTLTLFIVILLCMFNTVYAQDSDGDGITNINDLDDDNDGIPDTEENINFLPANSGTNQFNPHLFWDVNENPFPGKLEHNDLSPDVNTASSTVIFGNGLPGSQKNGAKWSIQNINSTTAVQAKNNNDYIQFSIPMASNSNRIYELKEWITYGITDVKVQNIHIEISNNTDFTSPVVLYSGPNNTTSNGVFQKYPLNLNYTLQKGVTYYVRVFVYGTLTTAGMDSFGLNAQSHTDSDEDDIPNDQDLDSDNDGCLDAIEGDENVTISMLVAAGGNVTVGTGSTAPNQNLCATGTCVNPQGIPHTVNSGGVADIGSDTGQGSGSSQNALVNACICYKPLVTTGTVLNTLQGITSLGRAHDNTNWPMVRKGAWIALEAKTKGFVPNRLTTVQKNALIPVEGMMVYDATLNCLSIYDGSAWKCFNSQTCPDIL